MNRFDPLTSLTRSEEEFDLSGRHFFTQAEWADRWLFDFYANVGKVSKRRMSTLEKKWLVQNATTL